MFSLVAGGNVLPATVFVTGVSFPISTGLGLFKYLFYTEDIFTFPRKMKTSGKNRSQVTCSTSVTGVSRVHDGMYSRVYCVQNCTCISTVQYLHYPGTLFTSF